MPKASPGREGGTKAQPQAGAAASPPPAPAPPPAEAPGEEGSPTGIAIPNGIAFRLDALHPPPVRPPHPRDLTRGEGGGGGQGPRPRQLGHGSPLGPSHRLVPRSDPPLAPRPPQVHEEEATPPARPDPDKAARGGELEAQRVPWRAKPPAAGTPRRRKKKASPPKPRKDWNGFMGLGGRRKEGNIPKKPKVVIKGPSEEELAKQREWARKRRQQQKRREQFAVESARAKMEREKREEEKKRAKFRADAKARQEHRMKIREYQSKFVPPPDSAAKRQGRMPLFRRYELAAREKEQEIEDEKRAAYYNEVGRTRQLSMKQLIENPLPSPSPSPKKASPVLKLPQIRGSPRRSPRSRSTSTERGGLDASPLAERTRRSLNLEDELRASAPAEPKAAKEVADLQTQVRDLSSDLDALRGLKEDLLTGGGKLPRIQPPAAEAGAGAGAGAALGRTRDMEVQSLWSTTSCVERATSPGMPPWLEERGTSPMVFSAPATLTSSTMLLEKQHERNILLVSGDDVMVGSVEVDGDARDSIPNDTAGSELTDSSLTLESAALKVQSTFRGYLARKHLFSTTHRGWTPLNGGTHASDSSVGDTHSTIPPTHSQELGEDLDGISEQIAYAIMSPSDAALVIQAHFRGFRERKKKRANLHSLLDDLIADDPYLSAALTGASKLSEDDTPASTSDAPLSLDPDTLEAAVTIQSAFRASKARQKFRRLKKMSEVVSLQPHTLRSSLSAGEGLGEGTADSLPPLHVQNHTDSDFSELVSTANERSTADLGRTEESTDAEIAAVTATTLPALPSLDLQLGEGPVRLPSLDVSHSMLDTKGEGDPPSFMDSADGPIDGLSDVPGEAEDGPLDELEVGYDYDQHGSMELELADDLPLDLPDEMPDDVPMDLNDAIY